MNHEVHVVDSIKMLDQDGDQQIMDVSNIMEALEIIAFARAVVAAGGVGAVGGPG